MFDVDVQHLEQNKWIRFPSELSFPVVLGQILLEERNQASITSATFGTTLEHVSKQAFILVPTQM